MPVPAGVLTNLVVVQAGFSFAGLEGLLDGPACSGGPGEVGESLGEPGQGVARGLAVVRVVQEPVAVARVLGMSSSNPAGCRFDEIAMERFS